jgi:hypothetical protein
MGLPTRKKNTSYNERKEHLQADSCASAESHLLIFCRSPHPGGYIVSVTEILKRVEKLAVDNSPAICTAIGVVGTITTAVLTGRAALKADDILYEATEERYTQTGDLDYQPTLKEKVLLVWPVYIPPVTTGAVTITCIIAANRIGNRRAAALAAAYTLSERAFADYKDKVVEKIGEKKAIAVRDEVAQDKVRTTKKSDREIIITGTDVLCLDSISGRYFVSNVEAIRKAVNDINFKIRNDNYASLSDFYNLIGLRNTSISDEMGWNLDVNFDVEFSTALTEDDKPCVVIMYRLQPIRGYSRLV